MSLRLSAFVRRLTLRLFAVGALAMAGTADAGDSPASDPLVFDHWYVDVEATMLGLSEAVSLDLDALAPAERAEELLRRETFLKALRLAVAADGTFVLGVKRYAPDDPRATRGTFDPRATRGTWTTVGLRRYRFTLTSRFGVATSKADAAPFDARIDLVRDRERDPQESLRLGEQALSFRDPDGTRLVFLRDLGNVGAAPTLPPPPAPGPSTPELPGSHPAAYVAAWSLDRDRMVDIALALARKQLDVLEPEKRKLAQALLDGDAARDQMRRRFEVMEIDVILHADGTLVAILLLPGQDQEKATGTWQEADGKVVLTIVTKNGRPATESDRKPVTARLDGGLLWLEMTGGEASAIPLRKSVR